LSLLPPPIRLAIDVGDPEIADRIAAALGAVEGIELVSDPSEAADAVVIAGAPSPRPAVDSDIALTPRELEVLALLAEGSSNKMIARRLGISAHTAKFHVGSLMAKLGAISRTDAVTHAARLGVINL
jgi:DNA-binding CsgD family transcriptional regulator